MKSRALLLCSVLSIAVLSPVALVIGQDDKKEAAKAEVERRHVLERKTLILLDEIVAGASGLKLIENRTFVMVSAANLLWDHDQKRARNLFWEALNTLNLMDRPADSSTGKSSTRDQSTTSYFESFGRRWEILNLVAKHDPQFALELLRATRQSPPESVNPNWRFPDERDLEQQIASAAAERDPNRAFQMASESLAKGLSLSLINLLFQLNQKDAKLGAKFAGEIIEKLRTADVATDLTAPHITLSLLMSARNPSEPLGQDSTALKLRQLKLSDEQKRELVGIITNAAVGASASPALLTSIGEVMPEIEQFAPERVVLLKRKISDFQSKSPQRLQAIQNYNLTRTGTPEEMLRASTKVDDDERHWIQREAIMRAVFTQRAESLREFIGKEINDESQRKSMIDSLNAQEIEYEAYKGNVEALRKLLPKIRLKEERARAMAEIAILMEKKGQHEEALSLLDEARTLIKTDFKSETQSNALLTLLVAYAFVEPSRAFEIIERTIDRANDEIAKFLLLDKLLKSGFVKKGEFVLNQSGSIPTDFAMLKYGKGLAALANADFNRTKAAADRLQRNELRIMARLLIAQALLGANQSPMH